MANPAVGTPLADQSDSELESVTIDISGNFTDADVTDTLTFSVTGLPLGSGLSVDPVTGVLSGTPNSIDIAAAPLSVVIKATDGSGNFNTVSMSLVDPTAGAPSESLPEITTGSTNYFVDQTNGSDSYDGLYPTPQGGTLGPKKTLAGIKALDLSSATGIYLKVGETWTGEQFWNQTDFQGGAGVYVVFGAYTVVGNIPYRGLAVGDVRPIVQGTLDRPHNYDGSSQLGNSGVFPSASATRAADAGLIGRDASTTQDGYYRVENVHVRHSGGKGITFRDLDYIQVVGCVAELCLSSGIRSHNGSNILFEDNYVTGCGGTQHWYGHNSRPHVLAIRGTADNVTIRGNTIWQNWGESTGAGHDVCSDFLIEDNNIFDNKHVMIYLTALQDSVVRRNLGWQSGKGVNGYSTFGSGGPNGLSYQGAEEGENIQSPADKTRNCAIHSNIMIGLNRSNVFQDQDANPNKGTGVSADLQDFWIFRNTFIDGGSDWGETGPGRTTSTGTIRVWDNMHLTYEDTLHAVDPDVPRGTRSLDSNSFNGTDSPGHFDNSISGDVWGGDESGWATHGLATWQSDGHIALEDVDAYVTAVRAKVATGGPAGAAIGGGHATNAYPASVTIATFENTDLFGTEYTTDDVGAIAD